MTAEELPFAGQSFCFTGGMLDLKRAAAEREVRARNGLSVDIINDRLDYLIVGDKPSPAWKFGKYGSKIAKAVALRAVTGARPRIVSESRFMEALARTPPNNEGALDAKVVVCNYKFVVQDLADYDAGALTAFLTRVQSEYQCHVSVRAHLLAMEADVFTGGDTSATPSGIAVTCRFVRQQHLDAAVTPFVESLERGVANIHGVYGPWRWFEQLEGSASYIRLLQEVPSQLRVAGL